MTSPLPGAGKVTSPKPSHLGGLRPQGASACKQLARPKHPLTAKRRAKIKALCAKLFR